MLKPLFLLAATVAACTVATPGDRALAETGAASRDIAGADAAGTLTLGDLALSDGFARATLPNAPVGGAFLRIMNAGPADDRLVAAASPAADRVEIHEMAMEGDVMRMRELPDGLPIPAGATVTLEPGGYHLMLMGLQHALPRGETVTVTLTFEQAGEIEMPLAIGAPNARAPAGAHGAHGEEGTHGTDHGKM